MIVRELVEELLKYDQSLEVMVYSGIDEGGEIASGSALCKGEVECPYFKGDNPYVCGDLESDQACVVIGDIQQMLPEFNDDDSDFVDSDIEDDCEGGG